MSNQVIVQKIGQFANDMEGTCSGEDSDMSRKIYAKNNNTGNDGNEEINDSTSIHTTEHMYKDLMSQFKALLMIKSPTDLRNIMAPDASATTTPIGGCPSAVSKLDNRRNTASTGALN